MGEPVGETWRLLVWCCRVTFWILGTAWRGGVLVWRAGRLARRWPEVIGPVLRCPQGHEVEAVGMWRCKCSAQFHGWVFEQCPACGEVAGWIACDDCGETIVNPLRG